MCNQYRERLPNMQDDSAQPTAPSSPVVVQAASVPKETTSNIQNTYEYLMLGFGIVTIFSFITNNGFLLKIGISAFLLVAVISITRSLTQAKKEKPAAFVQKSANSTPKKKPSILKILGITLLVICMLPVVGYMLLIGLFIIILMFGGGNMGT